MKESDNNFSPIRIDRINEQNWTPNSLQLRVWGSPEFLGTFLIDFFRKAQTGRENLESVLEDGNREIDSNLQRFIDGTIAFLSVDELRFFLGERNVDNVAITVFDSAGMGRLKKENFPHNQSSDTL